MTGHAPIYGLMSTRSFLAIKASRTMPILRDTEESLSEYEDRTSQLFSHPSRIMAYSKKPATGTYTRKKP